MKTLLSFLGIRSDRFDHAIHLARLGTAVRMVLRHIRLPGTVECAWVLHANRKKSLLIEIDSSLKIPARYRQEFVFYLERKLRQFGELPEGCAVKLIMSGDDEREARSKLADSVVSSMRVASIVSAAWQQSQEEARDSMRGNVRPRPKESALHDDLFDVSAPDWPRPKHDAPMTNIGALLEK